MSFIEDRIIVEGLTFDDVLLVPAYSEVLPRNVDLTSRFSKGIELKTPIVSAAMDTVTEAAMAISIAREGGIGVIHKNMTIQDQARQVEMVKRAENGMIYAPVTIQPYKTVKDALELMKEFKIGGIPVVDNDNMLVGIVTNRDLRFENRMDKQIQEVMTKDNLITTTESTDLQKAAEILQQHKIEKLPVVDKHNKLIGLVTYKDITKAKDKPRASKDSKGRLRVAAGVGVTADTMERVEALVSANVDAVVIDTAHGHSAGVIDMLRKVKSTFPNLQVVVGNIAHSRSAICLAEAGADAVKVGIGPGSHLYDPNHCGRGSSSAHGDLRSVESHERTRCSGNCRRRLTLFRRHRQSTGRPGASCVMAGSLFAGVEESPGETIIYNGRKFKSYRGMGSLEAMQKGSKDRYFQDAEDDIKKLVPEGIVARVPFKGSLYEVIYQMIGGLRAGMGYCGAPDIEALHKAKFVKITSSGMAESHAHDVTITSEAPNYSR